MEVFRREMSLLRLQREAASSIPVPPTRGERIRRRRECLKCAKRFTTYEVIENVPIVVIKKDKSRETFDRTKLLTACSGPARSALCPWTPWSASWMRSRPCSRTL